MPTVSSWKVPLRTGLLVSALVIVFSLTAGEGWFAGLEHQLLDWRFTFTSREVPTHPDIRLVYFDDATFEAEDLKTVPFSLWLPFFGKTARAVLDGGAKVVGLDILLSRFPDEYYQPIFDKLKTPPDERLSYRDYGMAAVEHPNGLIQGVFPDVTDLTADYSLEGQAELIALVGADNTGFLTVPREADGVVRNQMVLPVELNYLGLTSCSPFSALLAERFTGQQIKTNGQFGSFRLPLDRDGRLLIDYFPSQVGASITQRNNRRRDIKGPFPTFSMRDVLQWAETSPQTLKQHFANTVVIIGPGVSFLQDVHAVSGGGLRPGPEIHATVLNMLLTGSVLQRLPQAGNFALAVALSLGTALIAYRSRFTAGLFIVTALCGAYAAAVCVVFVKGNWVVDMARPLVTAGLTWALVLGLRMRAEEREKRVVRQLFGRYVSDEVMEELLRDPKAAMLGAVGKRRVTVLFADINGFSTIAEQRTPEQVMAMLNAYFEEMNQIIFLHGGTIKQFVGDEIMVLFGAPTVHLLPENAAVHAALEMVERLKALRAQSPTGQDGFYSIKVGVHTGDVIVGNVGSSRRTEYAAVGDDVNLGSRIMGMSKELGSAIVISAATHAEVKDMPGVRFTDKGSHAVKGRRESIQLYGVELSEETEVDNA